MKHTGTITLSQCNSIEIKLPEEIDLRQIRPKLYIFDVSVPTHITVRFDWIRCSAAFCWWRIPVEPGQRYQVLSWDDPHMNFNVWYKIKENLSFFCFDFEGVTLSYELEY